MKRFLTFFLSVLLAPLLTAVPAPQAPVKQTRPAATAKRKLPRPKLLGGRVELRRDPATGELRRVAVQGVAPDAHTSGTIRARVNLVEVGCNVFTPDGTSVRGLTREDFRLFEDGVEQRVGHFDASGAPASIALLLDASPSVYRELEEMKTAARALARVLSPQDEVAVVAFAAQAHLLLPFSRDRALLEQALASPELARVQNTSRSNIYQAVYFTVQELFRERTGRKAILLLTDGQDSGLGLSWDPASALPLPGRNADRLSFEDVARALAAAGVEVYAASTETRPRAMTEEWLAAHRSEMLVAPAARELGMPHYTLYLAELVRRAGGHLYFLREIGTLSEVYRRIAETLGAQYTLGYYLSAGPGKPGWRALRVELTGRSDAVRRARLVYRIAYYVPAEQ